VDLTSHLLSPYIAYDPCACEYFTTHTNTLYRMVCMLPLLNCISKAEANCVLREIHEGVCGSHTGSGMLAHKSIKSGYFWPHMNKDSTKPGGIKLSLSTLALCAVGGRHHGPPTHRKRGMQVFGRGNRLLHKVGRGRSIGNYNGRKCLQIFMEVNRVLVRHSTCLYNRQRHTV